MSPLCPTLLDEMATEARALVEPGRAPARRSPSGALAFMRYVGQGHEITVALPNRRLTGADLAGLREAFETDYAALFERHIPDAAIEVLSWSVLATTEPRNPPRVAEVTRKPAGKAAGSRKFFDGRAGEGRRDSAVSPRPDGAGRRPSRDPPSSPRTRPRPSSRPASTPISTRAGSIVMERKAA